MRQPHYLKVCNSTQYPRHAVWFDTETHPELVDDNTEADVLDFGWLSYRRRHRNNKWSQPTWFRFTTIDQFWNWVESNIDNKECHYFFCHNGSYDLPVLDAFNQLHKRGWQLESAVIDSPPVICKWRKDGKTIRFIDTLNIWRMPLAKIGEQIGIPKLDMPARGAPQDEWDRYGKRDVEVIMQACIEWWNFLIQHDLGGFAPTLASQAMKAFRHRFMHDKILIDDNEDALTLARQAYHGGRTECFYIGKVKGPLYQLDVNSMYPDVMRREYMPSELIGVYKRIKHLEMHKLLKDFCVIAEVTIETEDPVFPVYREGKLLFPVGRFATVLTTPEIAYGLDNGLIKSIGLVAIYQRAVIFKEYIDYLYALRLAAKEHNDKVMDILAKLIMNSLYGKFGQRGRVYETVEQVENRAIKVWTELDYDTGKVYKYRQFAGMVQAMTEEGEARDSHPAIAAHVTAHARMQLWAIYQQAGLKNCYYSDTDCVVVNQAGYNNLTNMMDEKQLGMLKLEKTIGLAIINGPKDYKFDALERIKGVRKDAEWIDANTVRQDRWSGLKGLLQLGDLSAPRRTKQIKRLSRRYTKGIVGYDGRVEPFRYG